MKVFRKKNTFIPILATCLIVFTSLAQYNLKDHKICYIVGYAHLDTQWQWTMANTISSYIPNTLSQNFSHFGNYSDYTFTFEGSYRYMLAKQYHPSSYNTLKTYIASGRWAVGGSWVDGPDVIVPSAESLIRHTLYGNGYFQKEFGKRSIDILLPDCFGFPYSLPTIATHCGLFGFTTQKFDLWGGWTATPFPIGLWEGVDGSKIIACLKPGSYGGPYNIRTEDGDWLKANSQNGGSPGVWATYDYMGTGDQGGAPSSANVSSCQSRINQNSSQDIKVICEASDKIYRDFLDYPELIDGLPVYKGELTMKTHGAGCYTAWSQMKWYNRKNEQLGMAAEHAAVVANYLDDMAYPTDKLAFAWTRFVGHQMHDDLTGTSIPQAYTQYSLPAEDSSMTEFTEVRDAANAKVVGLLDTRVSQTDRIPVVVYNPLGVARKDIVEATIDWGSTPPSDIQVFGPDGNEVPSQILTTVSNYTRIAFAADVLPVGYKVYQVSPTESSLTSELTITTSTLENENYKITVDNNGDISEVLDKKTNKQLLSAPSRFEMRNDQGTSFPAWEITYSNCTSSPREYVSGSVQRTIEESGPARVSLKVTRSQDGSSFTHYIRLGTKETGSHVEITNTIDWRSDGTLLKISFPLTCSNQFASFDMGIGAIARPNRTQNRYEVHGQQWADLTNDDDSYGVSILNDCKYGWDKESNSLLHLTLIHSPSGGGYNYQRDLSNLINWIHEFTYGIYGHSGKWQNSNTIHEAERMNQPLVGIQATTDNGGWGTQYSFLTVDKPEQVAVMALKKAELSDKYILRVRETKNESLTGAKISFGSNVTSVINVTGQEDEITAQSVLPRVKPGPVSASGKDITFDLSPFSIRAFALTLDEPTSIYNATDKMNAKPTIPFSIQIMQRKLNFLLYPNETIKKVVITNMAGKRIQVLHNKALKGNDAVYRWDGKNTGGFHVSSGLYVVNVVTNKRHTSQKLPMVQ